MEKNEIVQRIQNVDNRVNLNIGGIKSLIQLMNNLKDVGIEEIVRIPQIAVVGIQSAGKSAVLERIIGLEILPSADGLCTRTPIELRLYTTENEEFGVIKVVESENDKFEKDIKVKIEDLKDIILQQSDLKAGKKKDIKDRAIIVSVYSPKCPNLTLIDLPGIVNLPLEGTDQPANIKEITLDITKKYCQRPETIILCILASGVDITTNEILKYCKEVDPEGNRTIGVLT